MKHIKLCVYCNRNTADTIEHIVPIGLYKVYKTNKVLSKDFYIKVSVCSECNNKKSVNDELFRNLVVQTCAHKNKFAQSLLPIVKRSIEKNKRLQVKISDNNLKKFIDPYTNQLMLQIIDTGFDVFQYVCQLAKGIFYLRTLNNFDENEFEIRISQFDPVKKKMLDINSEWITTEDYKTRNINEDEIFQYIWKTEGSDYVCLLSFFRHENFVVVFCRKKNTNTI